MKIGVLTGGGDCPGLNAVIRAVVRTSLLRGAQVVGVLEGWRGLVTGETCELGAEDVKGIVRQGGTILRTSRTNPFKDEATLATVLETWKRLDLDALIAIGGEDTLGVADKLHREHGWRIVGVPKTIDNDLSGTDYTFGFDTAVSIATEAIDRLQTTAESHNRVIVVEVMGRDAGWIATWAGIAGGADVITTPEQDVSVDEICDHVKSRAARGSTYSIIVAAEGSRIAGLPATGRLKTDDFGHELRGGIAHRLAPLIEDKTGFETRVTVLGHVQRGGRPTAYDRVLATRFGVRATELALRGEFGKMVALRGTSIVPIDLHAAVAEAKTVPPEITALAEIFFG